MKSFETSTYLSQLSQLRKIAENALKQFNLKVKQIKFINHGENTTYKILAAEGIYLLRIHRANYHSKAALIEELKWLERLSKQMEKIPKPVVSKNGLLIEKVTNPKAAISRYCSLMVWQPGILKLKSLNENSMFATGLLTAQLHKSTTKTKVKHRNYWTLEGLLSEDAKFGSFKNLQADLTKSQYSILDKCRKMIFKKIKQYQLKYPEKLALIHADLHFGNIVWQKNEPIPIDFDDCGFGFHMYDLAVTLSWGTYIFRGDKKNKKQLYVESLLEGYSSVQNLTTADVNILPYFKVTRNLSMLLWLYDRKDNPILFKEFIKQKQKRIDYYQKVLDKGPDGLF